MDAVLIYDTQSEWDAKEAVFSGVLHDSLVELEMRVQESAGDEIALTTAKQCAFTLKDRWDG